MRGFFVGKMTLEDILKQIHTLVEGNTDYPSSTEDLYLTRVKRVELAIRNWANEEGVLWNELFVSLADASDGDKTVVSGTSEYSAPSDFVFPVGYLRLTKSGSSPIYYALIKPGDVQMYDNSSDKIWYVTGNKKTGYTIHINPTPGDNEDGYTIQYEYYKEPFIPSNSTDVIEMSDPTYIAYWAAAEEIEEENPTLYDYYTQIAINKLNAMKLKNDISTWWQQSGPMEGYSGFGK